MKFYDALDDKLTDFIRAQKMFFVATAPLTGDGSVNLSPKGYDSVAVMGPNKLAYLDLGGSGVETIAHVRENSRITLMWCAFEGAANIMRVYGRGTAVCFDDPGFAELLALFPGFVKARAVIVIDILKVQDSCGWGVPFMEFKGERDQLRRWGDHMDEAEFKERRYARNEQSLDGLPGLVRPK